MNLLGKIVIYRLSPYVVEIINATRTELGAHGNSVAVGDEVAMVVVKQWGPNCVNGRLLLDGPDVQWVTSVCAGPGVDEYTAPDEETRTGALVVDDAEGVVQRNGVLTIQRAGKVMFKN